MCSMGLCVDVPEITYRVDVLKIAAEILKITAEILRWAEAFNNHCSWLYAPTGLAYVIWVDAKVCVPVSLAQNSGSYKNAGVCDPRLVDSAKVG